MRILLAEDEKELASALTTILKRNKYTVDVVYNGEDALTYLKTGIYDLAILDIMMPKMDGVTALKEARNHNVSTPAIFLTAKSSVDDKVLGLDSGADDYLTKPFSMVELLARIRALLRRKTDTLEEDLTLGNLTLSQANYEISTPFGKEKLGNKEYQILELLMKKNATVSPDTILEKVWNYDDYVDISIVWVNIAYIRKKLANIKANVEIKALRNIGYSLEVKDV